VQKRGAGKSCNPAPSPAGGGELGERKGVKVGLLVAAFLVAFLTFSETVSALNIAMVCGDGANSCPAVDTDDDLKAHLGTTLGHSVTYVDDGTNWAAWDPSTGCGGSACDAVVISESVSSSNVADLKGKAIGILTVEGANWDEFDLGTGGDSSDGGSADINIVDNSHYITSVFSTGTITVATASTNAGYISGWSNDVTNLAHYDGAATWSKLLVVEKGGTLVDATSAAERRVFFGAKYFGNLNADGITLFNRALDWVAYNTVTMDVLLKAPEDNDMWVQNNTYNISASVTCRGGFCGKVWITPLNDSTNMSNTSGNTPFYIVDDGTYGDEITRLCPSTLFEDDSCTFNWTVNATGDMDYYDISALFTSNETDSATATAATIEIVPPYVEVVSFSSPANATKVPQNYTFEVNVSVRSQGYTENVQGVVQNSSYPEGGAITNMSNITGDSPFYIINEEPNPKPCSGNPLEDDETCDLGWLVNVTGAEGYYNLRVLFESSRAIANGTNTSNVTVQIVPPYMNVTLNSPATGNVIQGKTFQINATVVAFGDIGNVYATPRNDSTNMSNTTGDEPFYIIGNATKGCSNNPLLHGQYCELTWSVYTTEDDDFSFEDYDIHVYVESDKAGIDAASTDNATVTVYPANYNDGTIYNASLAENAIGVRSCATVDGENRCHIGNGSTWPNHGNRQDDYYYAMANTRISSTYSGTREIYVEHPGGRGPATLNPSIVHLFHDVNSEYGDTGTYPYYLYRSCGDADGIGSGYGEWTVDADSGERTADTEPSDISGQDRLIPSWMPSSEKPDSNVPANPGGDDSDCSSSATQGGGMVWAYCAVSCHNVMWDDACRCGDKAGSDLYFDRHGWGGDNNELNQCTECHSGTDTNFDHGSSASTCSGCHTGSPNDIYSEPACKICHKSGGTGTVVTMDSVHTGKLCEDCHNHGHNITMPQCTDCHTRNFNTGHDTVGCQGCHGNGSLWYMAHNTSIDLCTSCHNTSSVDSGMKSRRPVPPMWDSDNRLYHGNFSRGTKGGQICKNCHPDDYHNATVRSCQDPACHGEGGAGPYIAGSHWNLSCIECHNSVNITSYSMDLTDGVKVKNISTNIHSSWSTDLIPFNITQTKTTFTNTTCLHCHDNSSYIPQTAECHCCHSDNDGYLNIHTNMSVSSTVVVGDGVHGSQCTECHYSYFTCYPSAFVNESDLNNSVHKVTENAFYCTSCHVNTTGHRQTFEFNESYLKWCECCHVSYQGQAVTGGTPKWAVSRHNLTGDVRHNYFYNDSYTLAQAISAGLTVLNVTDCTACHDSTLITNARKYYNGSDTKDCRTCHPFPDFATGGSPY